jgi:hypothetical protein
MTRCLHPGRACSAAGCLLLIVLLACSATADARSFFVSPTGHDRRSGTTPAAAWRSISRVNQAQLRPGDTVAFHDGSVFRDAQLIPRNSGMSGAAIRFTSYGKGRATLTRGIWFRSISWVRFDHLRLVGAENGIASGYGSGSRFIGVFDNVITRVGVGVNEAHPNDYGWTIAGNSISRTLDSGIITQGGATLIAQNLIAQTGVARWIPWAKHGIYSKGANVRIVANQIVGFSAQGVSTRFRDAFISGNRIVGGPAGIGYWQQDPRGGTTVICGNTISAVHFGLLIGPESGRHRERFWIVDNHIATNGGAGVYVPSGRPALTAVGNVVSRRDAAAVSAARAEPCPVSAPAASDVGLDRGLGVVIGALNRITRAAARL